jgi:phosphatidylserine/phosphatidylglycerophosphate/cardiolipin synthase-like enzyme
LNRNTSKGELATNYPSSWRFIVIDEKIVLSGSLNWTHAALERGAACGGFRRDFDAAFFADSDPKSDDELVTLESLDKMI